MIFYYLDASAWVKRYYQETGTAWMQDLFAHSPTLASASLGLVEVLATLARKQRAGEIEALLLEQKIEELEGDWAGFIQIHLSAEAVEIAKDLAKRLALRGADAIHLASALLLQRRFLEADDRLIFIASDRQLKEGVRSSGLDIIDPEEQERQATPRREGKQ